MTSFIAFFIIILIGLFSSTLLRRFHIPWVVALILGGIILGPHGFHLFEADSTTEFLGQLGLIFLMFMAGLETKLSNFKESDNGYVILAFINGIIPFIIGYALTSYLGYDFYASLLVGIVFISSSIAVVIPTLEANDLLKFKVGKAVIITSIIQDIASLVFLSVILQLKLRTSSIPLYYLYPLLILAIISLKYFLPLAEKTLMKIVKKDDKLYQDDLRTVFLVLIGTVILFELLGLHSIIGGFFAGLVLSDTINSKDLIEKISALSYGIFIPTFFVLVGLNTDIGIFLNIGETWKIGGLIIGLSMLSKLVSGYVGSKLIGFNNDQAKLFAFSSIAQLSTTLATAYTAYNYGLIDSNLNSALVALSVISTFLGPSIMSKISTVNLKTE